MQGGVGAQPHFPWDHCGHVGYLWTGYVVQNGCGDSKIGTVEGGIAGALARHAMPRRAGCEDPVDLSLVVCADMEHNKGAAYVLRLVVCARFCSDWPTSASRTGGRWPLVEKTSSRRSCLGSEIRASALAVVPSVGIPLGRPCSEVDPTALARSNYTVQVPAVVEMEAEEAYL